VARLAGGIASTLRAILSPIDRDLAELMSQPQRKPAPDAEPLSRPDVDPKLESMRRKLSAVGDFVAELAAVGEVDPQEVQREADLVEVVRTEAKSLEGRAARAGVSVLIRTAPDDPEVKALARVAAGSVAIVVRALIAHALSASPRGSEIEVTVMARSGSLGSRVVIDDCGTALPAGARRALLGLEVEPGTFGRPSSVSLFVANEIAAAQGALLELGDAPVVEGKGGGLRVTLTFPR
jgi:signal transduction histidine kinase